jgi:hypothetical protein
MIMTSFAFTKNIFFLTTTFLILLRYIIENSILLLPSFSRWRKLTVSRTLALQNHSTDSFIKIPYRGCDDDDSLK